MLGAILCLLGSDLAGELIRQAFHLAVPGPVIGMFLLAAGLAVRSQAGRPIPVPLETTADNLIGVMGLLFVPAGVGIITELHLLREQWLPIVVALLGSTVLSLAVTGAVMHLMSRPRRSSDRVLPAVAAVRHE